MVERPSKNGVSINKYGEREARRSENPIKQKGIPGRGKSILEKENNDTASSSISIKTLQENITRQVSEQIQNGRQFVSQDILSQYDRPNGRNGENKYSTPVTFSNTEEGNRNASALFESILKGTKYNSVLFNKDTYKAGQTANGVGTNLQPMKDANGKSIKDSKGVNVPRMVSGKVE